MEINVSRQKLILAFFVLAALAVALTVALRRSSSAEPTTTHEVEAAAGRIVPALIRLDPANKAAWEAAVTGVSTDLGRDFWLGQVGSRVDAGELPPIDRVSVQNVEVLSLNDEEAIMRVAYTALGEDASIDLQLKLVEGQWRFNMLAFITPAGKGE